jgi:hypothetical protein
MSSEFDLLCTRVIQMEEQVAAMRREQRLLQEEVARLQKALGAQRIVPVQLQFPCGVPPVDEKK